MANMIIHPINHSFVAEISGVDIKSLTEDDFNKIYQAWLTYGVVTVSYTHLTLPTIYSV